MRLLAAEVAAKLTATAMGQDTFDNQHLAALPCSRLSSGWPILDGPVSSQVDAVLAAAAGPRSGRPSRTGRPLTVPVRIWSEYSFQLGYEMRLAVHC